MVAGSKWKSQVIIACLKQNIREEHKVNTCSYTKERKKHGSTTQVGNDFVILQSETSQ